MKKVKDCIVENCIPTPSSCVTWNGGDIEYLGICNGDSINNIVWEVVSKLEDIAGEDLSSFDIDSLLDICNQKAPAEITITSILTLLKENQVCLKEYIDELTAQLNELFQETNVDVDLKCYSEFDSIGNPLSITRDQLDQLVINKLCEHKLRIETLEGKVINLQGQIDTLSNTSTVEELEYSTCVDPTVKPNSSQVQAVADAHCDLEDATGDSTAIASALAQTPSDLNTEFGLITGWILNPANLAQNYNNLLLEVESLRQRVIFMEENCCSATCKDVELGFSAVFNEDMDAIIIRFTSASGTNIPSGFVDQGSTGVITDKGGNTITFNISIANNSETEIPITGLDISGALDIEITALLGTDTLTCEKCLHKTITSTACAYCEITATGEVGSSAVIVYQLP